MLSFFKQLLQRRSSGLKDLCPVFYSQYEQDQWLFENFYKVKLGGTFIEVGADDGVDKSNTYFFENQLDWTGLCIEPSPDRFKLLRENRRCFCEEYAITERYGEVEFLDISGWGKGLSGVVDNYDPQHLERIERELEHAENIGNRLIRVPTLPLSSLLEKHNITHVDFCSIDTEGSELEVIKSIDFSTVTIDIFLIEDNYGDISVKRILEDHGYTLICKIGIDNVFLRNNSKLKYTNDLDI